MAHIDVEITHPDRALFPDDGITKGDLVDCYSEVARVMLPHLKGRPLMLQRFPRGIVEQGFVQKDFAESLPDWMGRAEVGKEGGGIAVHPVAQRREALEWLGNQDCITPHVFLARLDRLDHPDRLVFDLDPSDGDFDTARQFARDVADWIAADDPDHRTVEMRKDNRGDRVYLDVMRNAYAQTAVAPYSVRPRRGAPVATPLEWDELDGKCMRPDRFTIRDLPKRVAGQGDPWSDIQRHARSLSKPMQRLSKLHDALA